MTIFHSLKYHITDPAVDSDMCLQDIFKLPEGLRKHAIDIWHDPDTSDVVCREKLVKLLLEYEGPL
jgi:hypothetical protein